MTTRAERESLAARLARAEAELQRAQRESDGSPRARTRLARARAEYQVAEALALEALRALSAPVHHFQG